MKNFRQNVIGQVRSDPSRPRCQRRYFSRRTIQTASESSGTPHPTRLGGAFEIVASEPLIAEIKRTLDEPYFIQRVDPEIRREILAFMRERTLDTLSIIVTGVASHPADDLILATALSADADVLVTGDKVEFLALLESQY